MVMFQDFIINGAGITSKKVIVCDVYNNVKLVDYHPNGQEKYCLRDLLSFNLERK
jgi:hypothetical protein